jgi:hypothetical protein
MPAMFAAMSEKKPIQTPRQARLAEALKRNIARRKAAAKGPPTSPAPSEK